MRDNRFMRALALRRVFTSQIIHAGMLKGRPVVALTDHLDDLIHAALRREARIAIMHERRRNRRRRP